MADSEPVDKIPELREACKPTCKSDWDNYRACISRVEKKGYGNCEPWYLDYLKCMDKCSVPKIMQFTK
eukprot:CAMPEP_0113933670 /NCGR_PEP_ID=MMETSP1339-20121228/926_1 /TAXON_ID=94617 /ORGANISM="Fibrocapsa japonica" /LENGTH=67 /DNA_ID=CAMNT_0000935077 /DNA_START=76 /DNA_END=279 /DNA_ORIENTATION=- /assembly_acc=CAM_ASM_000762